MKLPKEEILKRCNEVVPNTLMETLNISYVDVGEDFLVAEMPVNSSVHQPDGVLHGGAMVALAESVGSAACFVFLDAQKYSIRGLEISANHIKSVATGKVFAKATFIHKGRTTQVWNIQLTDEENRLISACKLTTICLPKK